MLRSFVLEEINRCAQRLELKLDGDILYYFGPMHTQLVKPFRDLIERMANEPRKKAKLCLFIKTGGGGVEPVEKMVDIIRQHYSTVWFFVPDFAMSAGTIFCLSGDKIWMDYSSSLGPIDPQVSTRENGVEKYVPALGVLEQVEKLIAKSNDGTISPAEFAILQNQNLAVLSLYEHARDLAIELSQSWLCKYKFQDWNTHRTDSVKKGQPVTSDDKNGRAKEIVSQLADHKLWHSHGRFIGRRLLHDVLRLEIDDYSEDKELSKLIRTYNDLLTDLIEQEKYQYYMHDKRKTAEG